MLQANQAGKTQSVKRPEIAGVMEKVRKAAIGFAKCGQAAAAAALSFVARKEPYATNECDGDKKLSNLIGVPNTPGFRLDVIIVKL